jgi:ubiquinone/menaquinone biosynthesis C-methylase UbiE
MTRSGTHLDRIRTQFGKQANVYARMQQTTDQRSLDALVTVAGANAGARVLDVACGPGFLTMIFAARCRTAVGLDATEPFLAMARAEAARRGLPNIEFRSGNAEQLPFGDGGFEVVVCRAAFHHFAWPARVLAEMVRVATPAGRLLVADMLSSEDPAKAAYHNRMERLCDPSHVRAARIRVRRAVCRRRPGRPISGHRAARHGTRGMARARRSRRGERGGGAGADGGVDRH